jgi:hypothetical protein
LDETLGLVTARVVILGQVYDHRHFPRPMDTRAGRGNVGIGWAIATCGHYCHGDLATRGGGQAQGR